MSYSNYLNTKHWKNKRKQIYIKHGYKCAFCFSKKNIHIHHRTYFYPKVEGEKRQTIFNKEKNRHLIPLCASCHKKWHFYHDRKYLTNGMIKRANNMFNVGVSLDNCIRFCFDKTLYKIAIHQVKGKSFNWHEEQYLKNYKVKRLSLYLR